MRLSRNELKLIAAAAMLVDHAAAMLLTPVGGLYAAARFVGRFTAPIMCFFVAEGCFYTSSRPRYIARLGVFALIAQPIFALALFGSPIALEFSMLATLFLTVGAVFLIDSTDLVPLKILIGVAAIWLCGFCDWSRHAPIWIFGFVYLRKYGAVRWIPFLVDVGLMLLTSGSGYIAAMQLGMLGGAALLQLYDGSAGERTPASKWGFYVFYPAHLAALYCLQILC